MINKYLDKEDSEYNILSIKERIINCWIKSSNKPKRFKKSIESDLLFETPGKWNHSKEKYLYLGNKNERDHK